MKKNDLKNEKRKKVIKYIILALVILVFIGVILWLFSTYEKYYYDTRTTRI